MDLDDQIKKVRDSEAYLEKYQKVVLKEKAVEVLDKPVNVKSEDLAELKDLMFGGTPEDQKYLSYLITKLKINPETLTNNEIEDLRKAEFLCKLHDEMAAKTNQETLMRNLRVVYSKDGQRVDDQIFVMSKLKEEYESWASTLKTLLEDLP